MEGTAVQQPESSTAIAPRENGSRVVVAGERAERADVTELLRLAVERGTPVEHLEKLVDLHERMEARQARRDFAEALAAFQRECPPIAHSKRVEFVTAKGGKVKYSYAELDEIAKVINPILTKHGLSYHWTDTDIDEKGMLVTTCVLSHVGGHSQSSRFKLPTQNESTASPQQKIGAAETYAKRRSLLSVLGLTTAESDVTAAAEVDPTPITADEVTHIQDLLHERNIPIARFLTHMEVDAVAKIRAIHYPKAIQAIENFTRRSTARSQP